MFINIIYKYYISYNIIIIQKNEEITISINRHKERESLKPLEKDLQSNPVF